MSKKSFNPGTMMAPLPVAMVTCSNGAEDNVLTIAWTGIINSEPPMTYVSVRPSRHSYNMIKESGEFVINLPNRDLVFATDYCGVRSGSKEDKFEAMHLTKVAGDVVNCPMIEEAPINLECKVKEVKQLGSHDMFMAEIVAVHVDEKLLDEEGRIAYEKAGLVSYVHGSYYGIGTKLLGTFGFSIMKPKTAKKRLEEGKKRATGRAHWTKVQKSEKPFKKREKKTFEEYFEEKEREEKKFEKKSSSKYEKKDFKKDFKKDNKSDKKYEPKSDRKIGKKFEKKGVKKNG